MQESRLPSTTHRGLSVGPGGLFLPYPVLSATPQIPLLFPLQTFAPAVPSSFGTLLNSSFLKPP